MKIGIITQSLRVNYGGILQNYALQKVLKNKGYDVVTIDQPCENEKYYRMVLSALRTFILKLFRKGGKRKYPTDICKRYRNFVSKNIQKFINEHIVFSKQLIDYEETKEYVVNHKIDAIIVGSDQVWRPKFVKDIYHSYIDFAEKLDVKRIAYAASFGVDNWEYNDIQTQRCSSLIKKFIGVSVRELSGIELCRKYLDVEAQLVLDPTLLLKSEDYMYLIKNENTTYKGIGVYLLDFNEEKMNFIAELAAQSGKNVFYI